MSQDRLNSFFVAAPAGLAILDPQFRFVQINETLARMNGPTVDEHLGKTIFEVLPKLAPVLEPLLRRVLTTGQPVLNVEVAGETPAGPGEVQHTVASIFPIGGGEGPPSGIGAIVVNITERKRLEESLRRAEGQIQRQMQRLHALRTIGTTITASLDRQVTLNVLIDQVIFHLGVDAADVLAFDQGTHLLEYAAGRGFHAPALQHVRLRLGECHAGRAVLERRMVVIANLAEVSGELVRSPMLAQEGFVAYYAVPLLAKGQVRGVLEVLHRAPLSPDQDWLDFLKVLAGEAAIAIDNAALFEELQGANADRVLAYDATLEGWSRAIDLRGETEGHSQRVTEMTVRLGRAMGIQGQELVHARRGALLHDIGNMGIPDSILLKPGPLSRKEREIMRRHPVYAYELLSPIAYLRPALDIPYCHHERWDGTGYPRGLRGEQIPLAARIFAVVDAWDALHFRRTFRVPWAEGRVWDYIRRQAGKHFDPRVVEAFLKIQTEL